MFLNCQRAEVSRLLICRHRNYGVALVPQIGHNVSICVRAGLSKPRPVPDIERIKDTKTLDYASTPLDANTLLAAVSLLTVLYIQRLPMTVERLEFSSEITINVRNKNPVQKLVPGLFPFIVLNFYPFC